MPPKRKNNPDAATQPPWKRRRQFPTYRGSGAVSNGYTPRQTRSRAAQPGAAPLMRLDDNGVPIVAGGSQPAPAAGSAAVVPQANSIVAPTVAASANDPASNDQNSDDSILDSIENDEPSAWEKSSTSPKLPAHRISPGSGNEISVDPGDPDLSDDEEVILEPPPALKENDMPDLRDFSDDDTDDEVVSDSRPPAPGDDLTVIRSSEADSAREESESIADSPSGEQEVKASEDYINIDLLLNALPLPEDDFVLEPNVEDSNRPKDSDDLAINSPIKIKPNDLADSPSPQGVAKMGEDGVNNDSILDALPLPEDDSVSDPNAKAGDGQEESDGPAASPSPQRVVKIESLSSDDARDDSHRKRRSSSDSDGDDPSPSPPPKRQKRSPSEESSSILLWNIPEWQAPAAGGRSPGGSQSPRGSYYTVSPDSGYVPRSPDFSTNGEDDVLDYGSIGEGYVPRSPDFSTNSEDVLVLDYGSIGEGYVPRSPDFSANSEAFRSASGSQPPRESPTSILPSIETGEGYEHGDPDFSSAGESSVPRSPNLNSDDVVWVNGSPVFPWSSPDFSAASLSEDNDLRSRNFGTNGEDDVVLDYGSIDEGNDTRRTNPDSDGVVWVNGNLVYPRTSPDFSVASGYRPRWPGLSFTNSGSPSFECERSGSDGETNREPTPSPPLQQSRPPSLSSSVDWSDIVLEAERSLLPSGTHTTESEKPAANWDEYPDRVDADGGSAMVEYVDDEGGNDQEEHSVVDAVTDAASAEAEVEQDVIQGRRKNEARFLV